MEDTTTRALRAIKSEEENGIPFKNDHYFGARIIIKSKEEYGLDICPKCEGGLNVGQCHRLDSSWEGVYCPLCGYSDPPLKLCGSASKEVINNV